MENMSSNLLLMEPGGGSFDEFLPTCRTAWCRDCSEQWMRLGGQDMLPRLRPPAASPYQVPAALTSRALRLTTRVFYHVVSLMRDG